MRTFLYLALLVAAMYLAALVAYRLSGGDVATIGDAA